MRHTFIVSACILLAACGGTNKKEFPQLELMKPEIGIHAQWVAMVGEVADNEYKQLPTVFDDELIYLANHSGGLGVVDAKTGDVKWQAKLKVTITAGPAINKTSLVIATDEAELISLDKTNGKELWRTNSPGIVLAKPLFIENKVVLQTISGNVAAFDKNSGKQLWLENREVPALTLRGTSSPIEVEGKIITGFANGKIVALEPKTGQTLWETSIAVPRGRSDLERIVDIDGVFHFREGILYAAAYQGRIAAISADSGQVIWMRDMSSYTGVISDGKQLYISDADGKVWALDANTGATLWRQNVLEGRDISLPAILSDTLAIGDGAGYMHWLSTEDGKLIGQQKLNDLYIDAFVHWDDEETDDRDTAVTVSPEIYSDQLYVRDNAGGLTVFKLTPKS